MSEANIEYIDEEAKEKAARRRKKKGDSAEDKELALTLAFSVFRR